MLPTKWEGKDIVVMDQVIVKGPGYRSEDCKAGKEAGSALARVKKVVSRMSCLSSQDRRALQFASSLLLWLKVADDVIPIARERTQETCAARAQGTQARHPGRTCHSGFLRRTQEGRMIETASQPQIHTSEGLRIWIVIEL